MEPTFGSGADTGSSSSSRGRGGGGGGGGSRGRSSSSRGRGGGGGGGGSRGRSRGSRNRRGGGSHGRGSSASGGGSDKKTYAEALVQLEATWDAEPPQAGGLCIYAAEIRPFLADTGCDLQWLLCAAAAGPTEPITGDEDFSWSDGQQAPEMNLVVPPFKLDLPLMFFVIDPSEAAAAAVRKMEALKWHHGQQVTVFEFEKIPTQRFVERAKAVASSHTNRELKRRWLEPFYRYSQAHRKAFCIAVRNPSATLVARNAVAHAVHVDDSGAAHVFCIWSEKQGGEWAMPGGKVDLADDNLFETAAREFREECPGFDLDRARDVDCPVEYYFQRNDPYPDPNTGQVAIMGASHKVRACTNMGVHGNERLLTAMLYSFPRQCYIHDQYPINTHCFVCVNRSFFDETSEMAGSSGVGRFEGIDALRDCAVSKDSPRDRLREYHRQPSWQFIEHEYFTWIDLPPHKKDGGLRPRRSQLPPGATVDRSKVRRENTTKHITWALRKFVAKVTATREKTVAAKLSPPNGDGGDAADNQHHEVFESREIRRD